LFSLNDVKEKRWNCDNNTYIHVKLMF